MLRKRRFISSFHPTHFLPPDFDGNGFITIKDVVLPTHSEYQLDDLLSAGVKVAPVSTSIIHDDDLVNNLLNVPENEN